MRYIMNAKLMLVVAVATLLVGVVACAPEEAASAAAAAPAAAASGAAPAAGAAAPGAPKAPAAAVSAAGAAPAAAAVAAAAPQAPSAKATAVMAAAHISLATEQRGQRVEVAARKMPLEAQVAVASGPQYLNTANQGLYNYKPWREGGRNRPWMHSVFMPPFLFDRNNEISQGFATAFTLSEDGKTYTFHLNPNAVFSDGTPLTADGYKWSIEYGVRPEDQVGWGGSTLDLKIIEGADAAIAGETEDISGIVALNDQDVQFTLTASTPTFPYRMATWLQGVFKAEAAEADPGDHFLAPIGVGPYSAVIVPNESVTMVESANYWDAPPIIKNVSVQHIADNSMQLLMFENGDLDVIYGRPGVQPAVHSSGHPMNQYLVDIPYAGVGAFIRWNTAREPFQDINIRKALSHAVDQREIIKAVYNSDIWSTSVLQADLKCWDPNNSPGYAHDVELAKQLLASSTYKTGDNVPTLQVQSRPDAGSNQWNLTMQAWQAAWKEHLNIDFKIHLVERGGETPPDINILRDSWGAYIPDPGFLLDLIVHTKTAGVMHVNDELDAKLDAANAMALSDPDRCAAMQEVDKTFMSNYYILPMTQVAYMFLVNPWVYGFETSVNNDFGTLPFMKMGARSR